MSDTQRRYFLQILSHGLSALMALIVVGYVWEWLPISIGFPIALVLFFVQYWITPVNYFLRRGARHSKRGENKQAVAALNQCLIIKKNYARALTLRGVNLLDLEDIAGAFADVDRAIELKPKFFYPYMVRSLAYYHVHDFSNALLDAVMAAKLKPKNAFVLNIRGLMYRHMGDLEQALKDIQEAVRRQPQNALFYDSRAVLYVHMGNLAAAHTDFEKALTLDPEFASAYHNRGECYLVSQNYAAALADFQKANQLKPNLGQTLAGLALTHHLMGNTGPAKNFWRLLVERDPRYADINWAVVHLHFPATLEPSLRELVNPS